MSAHTKFQRGAELYQQAYTWATERIEKADRHTTAFQGVVVGRFAELLVETCADLVKDYYQEDEFTCYSARETILDHFGLTDDVR